MAKITKTLNASQALKQVKKMLPKGYTVHSEDNSPYICDNVRDLWHRGCLEDKTEQAIRTHIQSLLGGKFCLKDWLLCTGKATAEEFRQDYHNSWKKLQVTRQLWLDDMIVHFKSKGM